MCTFICVHACVCLCVFMHVHIYIHMCVCVCVSVCVYLLVCSYVNKCVSKDVILSAFDSPLQHCFSCECFFADWWMSPVFYQLLRDSFYWKILLWEEVLHTGISKGNGHRWLITSFISTHLVLLKKKKKKRNVDIIYVALDGSTQLAKCWQFFLSFDHS